MSLRRALVIGGGVAGLAAAWQLARRGFEVTLLEREAVACVHASGRNAAIFRHAEADPALGRLALRSRSLLAELCRGAPWLEPCGGLYLSASPAPVDALEASARQAGVRVVRLAAAQAEAKRPCLQGGAAREALFSPDDGVMDIHLVTQALAAAAREAGARLRFGVEVERIVVAGGGVTGVALKGGERLRADDVVLAAGAWAGPLAEAAGAPLSLRPLRRHLVQLDVEPSVGERGPVVWRVDDDEVYFRDEGKGLLASPCDEALFAAGIPPTSPEVLEPLARRLSELAPRLAGCRVRRSWACLRTFAPDRNLVVGKDPRVAGLAWLAGLGGHGMTLAAAAAEHLAAELMGSEEPLEAISPRRFAAVPRAAART
jgi:D-arginine dehydrogenase